MGLKTSKSQFSSQKTKVVIVAGIETIGNPSEPMLNYPARMSMLNEQGSGHTPFHGRRQALIGPGATGHVHFAEINNAGGCIPNTTKHNYYCAETLLALALLVRSNSLNSTIWT
jgi:hypothetical protein